MYEDTCFTEAGVKQREVLRNLAARATDIMITLIEIPEEGLIKDASVRAGTQCLTRWSLELLRR